MLDGFLGFVRRLVEGFEGSGLDYAFTGALAVSFYGVPRTTSDFDVMVAVAGEADARAIILLLAVFNPVFCCFFFQVLCSVFVGFLFGD